MSISIDEQIELLEKQLSGLKKQSKINKEKSCIELLDEQIIKAHKLGIKIKTIYVSVELYRLCQSWFEQVLSCIEPPIPFYFPPIKYKGYELRVDSSLNEREINITVRL